MFSKTDKNVDTLASDISQLSFDSPSNKLGYNSNTNSNMTPLRQRNGNINRFGLGAGVKMSTPIEKIFIVFLNQIEDDGLALAPEDIQRKTMTRYLRGATTKFDTCEKDLTIVSEDEGITGYIEADLTEEEIEILALGMVCRWLQRIINSDDNLRNIVTDHDFKKTSNANLLKALVSLKKIHEEEFRQRKIDYSYRGYDGFE